MSWGSGTPLALTSSFTSVTFKRFLIFRRVRKSCEKGLLALSYVSVCLSVWNSSARSGRIFIKFDI